MTSEQRGDDAENRSKGHETLGAASAGFPPVCRADARVLILGSLPGRQSLEAREYYAHPRNAFWAIMRELIGAAGTYDERCAGLVRHGIALWDVLRASVRPGSMDADIAINTAQANDFNKFFSLHPNIERVCFNGRKAADLFRRLVELDDGARPRHFEHLPSTSPAHASMTYADKLARWRTAILRTDRRGQ